MEEGRQKKQKMIAPPSSSATSSSNEQQISSPEPSERNTSAVNIFNKLSLISSDSHFDNTLFLDSLTQSKWEMFKTRKIIDSHMVDLDSCERLYHLPFIANLIHLRLTHLFSLSDPVYPDLVKLFYLNLTISDEGNSIRTFVLGENIEVSEEELYRILDIPEDEIPILQRGISWSSWEVTCSSNHLTELFHKYRLVEAPKARAIYLSPSVRFLHLIICHVLFPRDGSFSDLTTKDWYAIDQILSNRIMRFGKDIMEHMIYVQDSFNGNLPYGSIITKILKRKGLDLTGIPETKFKDDKHYYNILGKSPLGLMKLIATTSGLKWSSAGEQALQHSLLIDCSRHPSAEASSSRAVPEPEQFVSLPTGKASIQSTQKLMVDCTNVYNNQIKLLTERVQRVEETQQRMMGLLESINRSVNRMEVEIMQRDIPNADNDDGSDSSSLFS